MLSIHMPNDMILYSDNIGLRAAWDGGPIILTIEIMIILIIV